ncbi:MAG: ATP-dependent sacrificial sulfur transferase LarE [Kiritimatiellae bacterium]|nr:ATP-dependent sacrificial sulfur transferase LarE [Kiritimatiellia bacterium]
MTATLQTQLTALEQWFRAAPFAIVAFSGGVDSSLVAYLARHFMGKKRMLATISASPSLKLCDLDEGKGFCLAHDIPLEIVHTQELENPNYAENPANRCYFCKHTLYTELASLAESKNERWILNGTNTDDLGDYRPGLQAAAEFKVRSPLLECDLDKSAVRALAHHFSLRCWNKPASPCLSSRIPYGQTVTVEKLERISAGEGFLNQQGFSIVRLRHVDSTAVIEVPPDQIADLRLQAASITQHMQSLGFTDCLIDDEGFVSGKLNRSLNAKGPIGLPIIQAH